MSARNLQCWTLSPRGPARPIEPTAAARAATDGAVVHCAGLLPAIGWAEDIEREISKAVESVAGGVARDALTREGLERLHAHLDAVQIVALADALRERLQPLTLRILKAALPRLGVRRRFFFDPGPKVRLHVPYPTWLEHRATYEAYATRRGDGKLTPHGPHHDSWHHCPTNAVNLWLSLGRSRCDNGMTVFPELFRKPVAQVDHEISPGQYYGAGIDTELEPGDAWLFAGDHLHTSVVNQSSDTRVGVSFRLTLGRPRVLGSAHERFVSSRWSGTALEWPTTALSGLLARNRRRAERGLELLALHGSPAPLRAKALEPLCPGLEQAGRWELPSDALATGQLRSLHRGAIAWRGESGVVFAAMRRCPHAGADLAAGEVLGNAILCPHHRLKLGDGACEGMPPLRALRCRESDGHILITRDA